LLLVDVAAASSLAPIDISSAANITSSQMIRTRINQEAIKRWVEVNKGLEKAAPTIPARKGNGSTTIEINPPPKDLGVVELPLRTRVVPREEILQEWEGQVQEVGDVYFSARLVDLTRGEKEETEESDLPIDDLVEADRTLLVPGAVFRWIIGYRWEDGEKERFTRVVIRRLPVWTEKEIRAADREAAELFNAFVRIRNRRASETGSD